MHPKSQPVSAWKAVAMAAISKHFSIREMAIGPRILDHRSSFYDGLNSCAPDDVSPMEGTTIPPTAQGRNVVPIPPVHRVQKSNPRPIRDCRQIRGRECVQASCFVRVRLWATLQLLFAV